MHSVEDGNIAEQVNPSWQACLAVCMKCAGKLKAMQEDKTQLRVALKSLVEERGLKEKVRPVDISCLDICPQDKIVVAHFAAGQIALKTVGAQTTPEEVLREFGY